MPRITVPVRVDLRELSMFNDLLAAAVEVLAQPYSDAAHDHLRVAVEKIVEAAR